MSPAHLRQKGLPRRPRLRFAGTSRTRFPPGAFKTQPQSVGQSRTKARVGGRGAPPQSMIEVRQHQLIAFARPVCPNRQYQRHRIRPARTSEHPATTSGGLPRRDKRPHRRVQRVDGQAFRQRRRYLGPGRSARAWHRGGGLKAGGVPTSVRRLSRNARCRDRNTARAPPAVSPSRRPAGCFRARPPARAAPRDPSR